MRIGIDARFYGSIGKGLGRYTEKLIASLEELDTENQYVIFLRRENFDEYVPRRSNFTKVLADYAWYGWREQLLFPMQLRRYHFDLVHFPHFNVPIFFFGHFVVTVHDLILFHFPTVQNTTLSWAGYSLKYALYRLAISFAIRRSVSVLTVSEFTKDDIARHYPFARQKIVVTLEATDHTCFFVNELDGGGILARYGFGGGDEYAKMEGYFLYVGNAYPHKNLEAIVAVARAFPAYRFVFVGKEDFFYRRLRSLTRGVENVLFTGFVSDQDLSVLYRKAIAYLFPSRYEGFGLPGLEAMQYGLPVIASNRGSLPEIYGDAAHFFDPDRQGDMERVVREILDASPPERVTLRERGFARVGRFHWRDMALRTLTVYGKGR